MRPRCCPESSVRVVRDREPERIIAEHDSRAGDERLARKRTAEERLTKQEQRQCRAEETRKRDQGRERTAKARAKETPQQREERLAKRREQDRQRRARARAQETQEESHCDGLARQSETELFEQYTVRRKMSMFHSKLMSL